MARSDDLIFVVVGAGAMGRIVVKDLIETVPQRSAIVVCDVDRRGLRGIASLRPQRSRVRVRTVLHDARNVRTTARLLTSVGAFAAINATSHHLNLAIMDAARRARAHYCDLGGLFHVTRKQLPLHAEWKTAGRLALLGIGAAPGIVNVMARSAADTMETVREIHVMLGSADRPNPSTDAALAVSYSIQTVIEEATQAAAVYSGGRMMFVPPLSGAREVDFPEPVGRKQAACTIHSEVATLPLTYKSRGLRECSFRIAFPASVVERLALLRSMGLLSKHPLPVDGVTVAPRDVLLAALRSAPPPPPSSPEEEYEILRVVVRGTRNDQPIEETVDCHTPARADWAIGSDINTGSPPSIAMQMLAAGEITARGCLPPERAIPAQSFFTHLERRGMSIRRALKPWSPHGAPS